MELEKQAAALRKRGLGVAAVSYDSVELLEEFGSRKGISYPLLSDPDSAIIRRFGLLNPEYPEGNMAHGVPYPGTFVTDARGIIRSKFFEKAYAERRTAGSLLALAGESPDAPASELGSPHFVLRTSSSNATAAPGNRVTLVLDFEMGPKLHAYAPGAKGYRALSLRLEPQPLVKTVHGTLYPASKPYRFEPLQETVPVFEGRFRVLQDVTLASRADFAELLRSPEPALAITGQLEYQVCSDKVCYPPASLPLRWTIAIRPLDSERSPESLRHRDRKPDSR